MTGGERIETWRQPDGYWGWRYVHPGEEGGEGGEIRLRSNLEYQSEEEARGSAEAAYPGVPVHGPPEEEGERPWERKGGPRRRPRRLRRALALVAVAALLRWAVRGRRRTRPPRAPTGIEIRAGNRVWTWEGTRIRDGLRAVAETTRVTAGTFTRRWPRRARRRPWRGCACPSRRGRRRSRRAPGGFRAGR
ncbi:hypothetical protein GCM10010140_47560 [Streptosporangium pseudovulgare]|uniref:DUF1508 domain-containing protein n=1 Tax=Streptosporangium pseudovulgare TaxID=35765 RepID=A0ABQ2R3J1_9ACTN|nr:hypothetical protein GCM10010140_47560 [Streptosporangium pseudovulgare]